MKARAFDYCRATTIEDAMAAFAACAGEARYLAGGQSLLATLNLRLDAPDLLIDIARIEALRGVELVGDRLRIGALTRHAEILRSPLVQQAAPLLAQAAAFVAHPAIRNRGTLGGSLALADPASEFPACVLALGADIEITGHDGRRTVAADNFFRDLYETDLAAGEILSAVLVPAKESGQFTRFDELARRRGDYALVGTAANVTMSNGAVGSARLAFCAVGSKPMRARRAERALTGHPFDPARIRSATEALGDDLAPDDDDSMSGATKLRLARVLLGRVLATLASEVVA